MAIELTKVHAPARLHAAQSHARLLQIRLVALLPMFIAAVMITGDQYSRARRAADSLATTGWRDEWVIALLGTTPELNSVTSVTTGLIHLLPALLVACAVALIWERIFAMSRDTGLQRGLVVFALTFTLLMPPAVGLWHIALGVSFGMIFGRCLYGGDGKSFLNPALLGVAFLQIAYPAVLTEHPLWTSVNGFSGSHVLAEMAAGERSLPTVLGSDWWQTFVGATQGLMGTTSTLAILSGAVVLLLTRTASWRLMISHLVGAAALAYLVNVTQGTHGLFALPWFWHLITGSFAFCVVFIATDPASACSTHAGRWTQGMIVGALVIILRVYHPAHPDSVIPAFLFGSILAPLIDHCVTEMNIWRRRHGYV